MTEEPVAVVGGRVVPVAGDPIDGGTVLAEAGRITAVGTAWPSRRELGSSPRRAAGSCPGSSRRTVTTVCHAAPASPLAEPTLLVDTKARSSTPASCLR